MGGKYCKHMDNITISALFCTHFYSFFRSPTTSPQFLFSCLTCLLL